MFFSVSNKKYLSPEQLRTKTIMNAYFIIKNYPMHAADMLLDKYIQQQYKESLKNMCVKLLLNLTFYKDDSGNLIVMFKNPKHDAMARLITYGNGAIPGSKILQLAINN